MTGVSGNNRNTPPHWDIALLGLWWSCNYGAVLTSFSLHCVLSRQGYRVLLLDHAPMTMASHVNDPGSVFRTFFREEGIESIPISSRRDAERTNRLADTFIAGSDQLWNYKYTHNQDMQYYLDFVDGEKRKIAYATLWVICRFSLHRITWTAYRVIWTVFTPFPCGKAIPYGHCGKDTTYPPRILLIPFS